jgi:hypothetical protein
LGQQGLDSPSISLHVPFQFGFPEIGAGSRQFCETAIFVHVPETPMNEDGYAPSSATELVFVDYSATVNQH